MSCITQLLKLKGDKEFLPINNLVVIEGGGLYKDYEYLITFVSHGHRCGYVAIPEDIDINVDDISCHGDITFEDREHSAKALLPLPCNDLWIGFDAAHWNDVGCAKTIRKYFPHNKKIDFFEDSMMALSQFDNVTHKTYEYMENECKSIIDQIIEMRNKNAPD